MDEYDADQKLIVEHDDQSVSVHARLDTEDLEDYLDVELPEGEFESVGGFVINLLGRVPIVGEVVRFQDLEMVIEAANNRKIERIRIRKVTSEDLRVEQSEEALSN